MTGEFVVETERRTEVAAECDVLVVGGGPAGVCAATAAARAGADTVLVERSAFLGGTATGAMVASFMGFFWDDRRVTGGIGHEITQRVKEAGGSPGFMDYVMADASENPYDVRTFPLDPEILKIVLDDIVSESGVRVLFHTQAVGPLLDNGRVVGAFLQGVSERKVIRAKTVVDAGADGLIARLSGAEIENNRADPRTLQPMTQMAHLTSVDVPTFRAIPKEQRRRIAEKGIEIGALSQRIMSVVSSPHGDDAIVLMTRISGRNGADEMQLAQAEMEGRKRVRELVPFLRTNVPGFEACKLIATASWIGVRETWRVVGDYVLTGDDVLNGRKFDDGIAVGGGPLDVHHSEGGGTTLLRPNAPFTTPYRSLLPVGVEGQIVAGRCVSATKEAMGAMRHMGSAMALGHAAGVGAALAAQQSIGPRQVHPANVRELLREQGAIIDQADAIVEDVAGALNS